MASSDLALRALWRYSLLGQHERSRNAYEPDLHRFDPTPLLDPDYRWSSGERVLIDLACTFWSGSGTVTVGDLARLDDDNRAAAVEAIRLWLLGGTETHP